jgi:large repetitive protein
LPTLPELPLPHIPAKPSTPAKPSIVLPVVPARPYTPAKPSIVPKPEIIIRPEIIEALNPQKPKPEIIIRPEIIEALNPPSQNPTQPGNVSKCNKRPYPKDIDNHWSEIYVRRLYDLCITEGYSDRTFRPNQHITRAELVKMSLFSRKIQPKKGCYDNDCGSPFRDLDRWQGPWIRTAWDRGIIEGYQYDRFRPNRSITRAEAVKVILATYGYDPTYTDESFFQDVSGWSVGWIERAHEIGLVQGVGNGNFDPNRPITRGEAAKIIAKMMEYWDTRIR